MQNDRDQLLEDILMLYGGGGGGDAGNQQEPQPEQLELELQPGAGGRDGGGDAGDPAYGYVHQIETFSVELPLAEAEMDMDAQNVVKQPREQVESTEHGPNELLRFSLRLGFSALMHPYEYAKVLMQLGHEPLPAVAATNWFLGRSTLLLPGVHQYIRYIKYTDGIAGLYRGLAPRLLGNLTTALFSSSLVRLLGISPAVQQSQQLSLRNDGWDLLHDGIVIVTGLVISQPFYVITVRQMAQFIGREVVYTGIWGSMREIYAVAGWRGFYVGVAPRLLCDLGVLLATSTLSAICNRSFRLKPSQREYNATVLQFVASMMLYPLHVVGACMACSGSGIAAGAPPFMPIYGHWTDCLTDLMARGDHFRGALFFRRTLPKMQRQLPLPITFPTVSRMI